MVLLSATFLADDEALAIKKNSGAPDKTDAPLDI